MRPVAAAIVVAAMLGCAAPKPPSQFEVDYDEATRPWQEIATQLPGKPGDGTLMIFPVSGATQYRFGIDAKSLSIGTDGVFRYTLVATSREGVNNVSYEGIRCQTRERKIYAIARDDGTWVRARNAGWEKIVEVDNNRQHAALMKDIFCPDSYPAQSVAEVVKRLERKLPSTIL